MSLLQGGADPIDLHRQLYNGSKMTTQLKRGSFGVNQEVWDHRWRRSGQVSGCEGGTNGKWKLQTVTANTYKNVLI